MTKPQRGGRRVLTHTPQRCENPPGSADGGCGSKSRTIRTDGTRSGATREHTHENADSGCSRDNPFRVQRRAGSSGSRWCPAHFGFIVAALLALVNRAFARRRRSLGRGLAMIHLALHVYIALTRRGLNRSVRVGDVVLRPPNGNRQHSQAVYPHLETAGG